MPELTPISPLLDMFFTGQCISQHHGVCCYPAVHKETDEKYIVKVISIPASSSQVDVLLMTGAVQDQAEALAYFATLAQDVEKEAAILNELSLLEGFLPTENTQCAITEDGSGYRVYLLTPYRKSLDVIFRHERMTHLAAVNMGLDLCAALASCRRAGYLYVDLKPENIFLDEKRGYCIGDLGFIAMSGLKYASLPDKYRSRYTTPEMEDALAELSTSLDIYALGLVLYQAYNGGVLPEFDPDQMPAPPLYADYEMAEIILKACNPDPANRWQDPSQMGQALVSYLQRNTVNDVPILPEETPDEDAEEAFLPDMTEQELSEALAEEDVFEEMSLEELPEMDLEEAANILAQADELLALVPPAPVVAPEAVDIPMPEPIVQEQPKEDAPLEESSALDTEQPAEEPAAVEITVPAAEPVPAPLPPKAETKLKEVKKEKQKAEKPAKSPKKQKRHAMRSRHVGRWIAGIFCVLLLAFIGSAGYYYYSTEYILNVDNLSVTGTDTTIAVQIDSQIPDVLLSITCTDSYGNTRTHAVENGAALFENLNPQTHYYLRLNVTGFHKLTGITSDSFTTASQTRIHSFNAAIGQTDGSVILGFTASGPMPDSWSICYSAEGEEPKTVNFAGTTVSISGLTVGKSYSFQLLPSEELYIMGQSQLVYTASNILFAKDLTITECRDGTLTVCWSAPQGETVEFWTVHCYNASGYDETVIISDTEYKFKNLTHDTPCTVEVTAVGMTQSVSATICADPVTVWGYPYKTDNGQIVLSWNFTGKAPENGWILQWSVDGAVQPAVICDSASASIPVYIPGGNYEFILEAASGAHIFGNTFALALPEASVFNDGWLTAADIQSAPCLAPVTEEPWTWQELTDEHFTRNFAIGQQAHVLLTTQGEISQSETAMEVECIFHTMNGQFVSHSKLSLQWNTMWTEGGCLVPLSGLPEIAGEYVLSLYFNGAFVATETIIIQ